MYPTAGGVCRTAGGISSNQEHRMDTASTSRRPAFLCALILLVCALATHPIAEIGMIDDWSSAQSARMLALTGHIVYNGWSAPILGWQLYLGALFIKFFGPSYAAVRASVVLVSLLTAYLSQRTLVRAGINSRNATIGTLTLVLCPLTLPLVVSFMSDMGALLFVLLCLYACLRALQAQTDRAVLAWLAFAALSNAFGGNVRQIAWLGVLVMFPCTIWLLRRRRHVLLYGSLLYALSILIVFATLHWFQQQPYSVPEPLFVGFPDRHRLFHILEELLALFLSFALFLLPVLFAFVPAISLRNRRAGAVLASGGILCLASYVYIFLFHRLSLLVLIAPFRGFHVTRYGLADTVPIKGLGPIVLTGGPRLILTFAVLLGLVCLVTVLLTSSRLAELAETTPPLAPTISWNVLLVLLVPFSLAYLALLLPRSVRVELFDRYLLLLLPIGLILLLRLYQDRVQPNLPLVSSVLVLLFGLYSIAGTHDFFSRYRGRVAAIDELRSAGVPDAAIDAGFEHNGMAQIERYGFINDPKIHLPPTATLTKPSSFPDDCHPEWVNLTPVMVPDYALSFDPAACGGKSQFAPVTYSDWLARRDDTIYIVYTTRPSSSQH
jgi:hypothetical protein